MKRLTLPALLALLLALTLGLAACGGNDEGAEPTGTPGAQTGHMDMDMDMGGADSADGIGVVSPAADLRATLDTLLGEHAVLAMAATQKGLDGAADFPAIAEALDANSVAVSEAIGSVYGDEAAKEFLDGKLLWRDHIGFFVDYTVGLAKNDKAAQDKAVGNLMGYNAKFAAFLANATDLPQNALQDAIAGHIGQLKGQIDSYSQADYGTAYEQFREAYEHMFMTGDTLAGGIAQQSPAMFALEPATQSASDLRITLDRLLGEHAILAMLATQKGLDGAADFPADRRGARRQQRRRLRGHRLRLRRRSRQGVPRRPAPLARPHRLLRRLHRRPREERQGRPGQGSRQPHGLQRKSANFLANATGLPQAALQASIGQHITQLKGQIDAYAAGDYEEAYRLFRQAYRHMVMTGDTLAAAIVKQNPDAFSR